MNQMMFREDSPTANDTDHDDAPMDKTHSNRIKPADDPIETTQMTPLRAMGGQLCARPKPDVPDFTQLANVFDTQDQLINCLRQENQLLHRKLATMNGVKSFSRKRAKSTRMRRLPSNVILCASPSEIAHLMSKMTQSDKSAAIISTTKDGTPQITFKPDSTLTMTSGLMEFTNAHVKRPSVHEKAIVLSGKHRGEHVTVLGINAKDQSAVVKVERMTKAAKDANANECELDSTDDEKEADVMDMEWLPNDIKTDVPLSTLGVRFASGTAHA